MRGEFIDRGAWPWLDASKETTQWRVFKIFVDGDRRVRDVELRRIVDVLDADREGLRSRPMDIGDTWAGAGRGPIVLGDDFDQDRSGVDQVDVGSQVVRERSVGSDLRLNAKSRWIERSNDEADGLSRRADFIGRRWRSSDDVGQEAWQRRALEVFLDRDDRARNTESWSVVDVLDEDREYLLDRTIDVRYTGSIACSRTIVDGYDADEDRSGVQEIDIGSEVIGQLTGWVDARLSSQSIESSWVQRGDFERNGLPQSWWVQSEFIGRRRRTGDDVRYEANDRRDLEVLLDVDHRIRNRKERSIVDFDRQDREGPGCRAIVIWTSRTRASRIAVIDRDDFDQDRRRVQRVDIGIEGVGQGSVGSDRRLASGGEAGWIQRRDLEANCLSRYPCDQPQLIVGGGLAWENQVQESRCADACILERRLRRARDIEQWRIVHIVDVDRQGAVDQGRRHIVHSWTLGLLVATGNTGILDQDTDQYRSVDQVVVVGRWGVGDAVVDEGQRFTQTAVRDEFGIDDSERLPRLVGIVDIPIGPG